MEGDAEVEFGEVKSEVFGGLDFEVVSEETCSDWGCEASELVESEGPVGTDWGSVGAEEGSTTVGGCVGESVEREGEGVLRLWLVLMSLRRFHLLALPARASMRSWPVKKSFFFLFVFSFKDRF